MAQDGKIWQMNCGLTVLLDPADGLRRRSGLGGRPWRWGAIATVRIRPAMSGRSFMGMSFALKIVMFPHSQPSSRQFQH